MATRASAARSSSAAASSDTICARIEPLAIKSTASVSSFDLSSLNVCVFGGASGILRSRDVLFWFPKSSSVSNNERTNERNQYRYRPDLWRVFVDAGADGRTGAGAAWRCLALRCVWRRVSSAARCASSMLFPFGGGIALRCVRDFFAAAAVVRFSDANDALKIASGRLLFWLLVTRARNVAFACEADAGVVIRKASSRRRKALALSVASSSVAMSVLLSILLPSSTANSSDATLLI